MIVCLHCSLTHVWVKVFIEVFNVAGASPNFRGEVIYICHALCTSEVLAVAISCIAWVRCGSWLDHRTRVSGHVCSKVSFHTCVVHLTMMYVATKEWHVGVWHNARWHDNRRKIYVRGPAWWFIVGASECVYTVNWCGHGYLRLSDNLIHAWVQVCIEQFRFPIGRLFIVVMKNMMSAPPLAALCRETVSSM